MKKNGITSIWIVYTIVFISLGISVWSLIIANSDVRGDCEMNYNYSKVIEFAGLIFTVMGVVFSLYFVIIGIDAHKIQKDLEEIDNNVKEEQSAFEEICKNVTNAQKNIQDIGNDVTKAQCIIEDMSKIEMEHQDALYSHLMLQAKAISDGNMRQMIYNSSRLLRARLATQSKFLPLEKRKQRIPDLIELGEFSDIEDIDKIINDSNEDRNFIELVKGIKQQIIERLECKNNAI